MAKTQFGDDIWDQEDIDIISDAIERAEKFLVGNVEENFSPKLTEHDIWQLINAAKFARDQKQLELKGADSRYRVLKIIPTACVRYGVPPFLSRRVGMRWWVVDKPCGTRVGSKYSLDAVTAWHEALRFLESRAAEVGTVEYPGPSDS